MKTPVVKVTQPLSLKAIQKLRSTARTRKGNIKPVSFSAEVLLRQPNLAKLIEVLNQNKVSVPLRIECDKLNTVSVMSKLYGLNSSPNRLILANLTNVTEEDVRNLVTFIPKHTRCLTIDMSIEDLFHDQAVLIFPRFFAELIKSDWNKQLNKKKLFKFVTGSLKELVNARFTYALSQIPMPYDMIKENVIDTVNILLTDPLVKHIDNPANGIQIFDLSEVASMKGGRSLLESHSEIVERGQKCGITIKLGGAVKAKTLDVSGITISAAKANKTKFPPPLVKAIIDSPPPSQALGFDPALSAEVATSSCTPTGTKRLSEKKNLEPLPASLVSSSSVSKESDIKQKPTKQVLVIAPKVDERKTASTDESVSEVAVSRSSPKADSELANMIEANANLYSGLVSFVKSTLSVLDVGMACQLINKLNHALTELIQHQGLEKNVYANGAQVVAIAGISFCYAYAFWTPLRTSKQDGIESKQPGAVDKVPSFSKIRR